MTESPIHRAAESNGNGNGHDTTSLAPEPFELRPGLGAGESRALAVSLAGSQTGVPSKQDRRLNVMPRLGMLEEEPAWKRALYFVLVAGFLVGYAYVMKIYWAPAHPGINQNGYLVGGKNLAEHGTMGMVVKDGYAYLGWMWNIVDDSLKLNEWWFYPKYPIGTSALFAACLKISQWTTGNWEAGKLWSFYVNPASVVLALAGMFMLLRQFCGSFIALLGTMILGCCQVLLSFAEQPLSHGPAICMVTWGMFWLLRYWQTESSWRGILAGLCLGYAVTIRYTEGLLLLPLAAVLISMVRFDVKHTRWWSLGLWLAIALAAIIVRGTATYPLEATGYKTYGLLALLTLGMALIPALLDRRLIEGWTSTASLTLDQLPAQQYASNLLPMRTRRWAFIAAHAIRVVVVGALVWAAVFFDKPPVKPSEVVDRMFEIVAVKTFLLAAAAMLHLVPWAQPRRYLKLIVPTIAWLIPVGFLVAYNWFAMHSISGYDSTNESTAFTWRTFSDKWDDTVQQLYDYSMFLIPPLALAGIFLMYRWNWRAALLTTLWLVPGMLLYIAYYYGKQRPGMWYLRFFLTLFPPMLIAAMWLLRAATDGIRDRFNVGRGGGSIAIPLGLGVFTFCSCAVGLWISLPPMERELAANWNLAYTRQQITLGVKRVPNVYAHGKPLMFAEGRGNPNGPLCNYLQFAGDFDLYSHDGFGVLARQLAWGGGNDPDAPNPLQPRRQDWLSSYFQHKVEADLIKDQNKLMSDALDAGRPVFAVLQPGSQANQWKNRFVNPNFEMTQLTVWREPARVTMERATGQLDPLARGMPLYPSRTSQSYGLYQITRKPKPPAPASAPVVSEPAKPATQPSAATKPVEQKLAHSIAQPPMAPPTTGPADSTLATLRTAAQALTHGGTPPGTQPTKVSQPATAPSTSPTTRPAK